jgi:hypothetical protein
MKGLFAVVCLVLVAGCGKKQPLGYPTVEPREGEINIARGEITSPGRTWSEYSRLIGCTRLFAGKAGGFEAITFVYFDFDTLVTPESLWVVGWDSASVEVCAVTDSFDIDSVNWSNMPALVPFDTIEMNGEDTCVVGAEGLGEDSIFYVGFRGSQGMGSLSSSPWMTLKDDTSASLRVRKQIYVDTSYISQDSLPDSLTFIETGAFATRCTLFLSVQLVDSVSADSVDTMWVRIDSLTDSLRQIYSLDSATVSKAEFKIAVDEKYSYKEEIRISAEYEAEGESSVFSSATAQDDSLVLSLRSVIEQWFKKGDKLWLMLEGDTKDISRVVLDLASAELRVVYTLPPKER